jgi:hypothetical protein
LDTFDLQDAHAGSKEVGQDAGQADGQQEGGFVFFGDGQVDQYAADRHHQDSPRVLNQFERALGQFLK